MPILENRFGIYNEYENILTEPNKGKNILYIKEKEKKIKKKLISLTIDKFYEKINNKKFFVPRHISISFNKNIKHKCYVKYFQQYRSKLKKTLSPKELLLLDTFIYLQSIYKFEDVKEISEEDFINPNIKEIIVNLYKQLFDNKYLNQIKEEEEKKATQTNRYNEKVEILIEAKKSLNLLKKIDDLLYLLNYTYDELCSISINRLKENHKYIELIKNLPKFLELDFYSSGVDYYSELSTGEKSLLEITYSIIDIINLREKDGLSRNIFILLDEIENNLNPNWQKKLLSVLIDISSAYSINIHFIITTHSPFILSDLPKENVIFLEKGKQVYPFEDNQQTFGANIHTLLSHGFFMKDGLMGEFAKDKIDKAIKYLNQKAISKEELDYCENIISIIGEPIIKRELQRMLKNKMELSNKEEIDTIKEEIKELTEKLEKLEGKK
ncbi:conserved hypothetical protein [Arcobacter nitrofigilis DSM 7299]|uniref:ATPase AAA-type core domain-containing protein n=1 Tax=Arcobacter nitrofigilis (strain ATCC 33309 / DSM 7299 / CCUG 15893 / LMG 7604 / NCTC 12251 / CI) TaxID=572480 RepID=D5V7D3_ARCNC|nr:AAA family ATPase [Arcobacter nitrofigilis]ADG94553.1 conserved hypothetical protein [Arcobacter nitrofigilis DSM 7299]